MCRKYSLFINVDKTKVMASDGIACRIVIQKEQWKWVECGYVPVPWVPDCRRWRVYDGIPYQVKQEADDRGISVENKEKLQHTASTDTTVESAGVACSKVHL